jgi:hypothetical protein
MTPLSPITHRMDDRYIERAWRRANTTEIEALAANIDADLSRVLYLAFKAGFLAAIGGAKNADP